MTAVDHEIRELPGDIPPELGGDPEPGPSAEVRLIMSPDQLRSALTHLHTMGARFITMTQTAQPNRSLLTLLALRGALLTLRTPAVAADGLDHLEVVNRVAEDWPAARWAALELAERHGVQQTGRRLTAPDADVLDRHVDGLDVFAIPYGPVRSGVFESIQFQIESGGESVVALQTRPFFKHRGLEARFRGLQVEQGVHVAERVAGIATVAYACAYAQAVERALGIEVHPLAERWRAVHCELERIACHLDVIAKEAETTALYVGHARFQILKERVMRLRARLSGSRFARGVVVPGGVREIPPVDRQALRAELDDLERQFQRDRKLFISTASMTDRLIGSGMLPRALIDEYGAVGPLARGSNVSTDARHERPYGDYPRLGLQVMTRREEDAMARVNVRFDEIAESLRILHQALEHVREPLDEQVPSPQRLSGSASGWVEAPQGELVAWVEVDEGRLINVHLATPSFRNWALFDHAFPKDVLTDFAFIEHSFGLTPAGADR